MTRTIKPIDCVVYKGSGKPDTYLFVLREDDFSDVPESLLQAFGQSEKVITLTLSTDTRLARNNTGQVIHDLETQGYHLQMPPPDPLLV